MNTYILPENEFTNYEEMILKQCTDLYEMKIMTSLKLGLVEMDLEEAKKAVNIGDYFLIEYDNKLVPMQIIDKDSNNVCTLMSAYILENHKFDDNTNVYKNSDIRSYMNGEFLNKFDKEFVDKLITSEVHTDNYTTSDKMWIPSHEEVGYLDSNNWFKKNVGTQTYKYFANNKAS